MPEEHLLHQCMPPPSDILLDPLLHHAAQAAWKQDISTFEEFILLDIPTTAAGAA